VRAQVVATGPGSIKRWCLLLVVLVAGRGALLAGMAGLLGSLIMSYLEV
jgi:hypothetical protein